MRIASILLLISICLTLNFSAIGQTNSSIPAMEKFHINKTSEDEIGYTQAIKVGNTIYVSGAVGWGKMQDALKLVYDEINKSLKNYNASFENIVKENLYSTALDSVIKYKEIRRAYYGTDFPAATWVEVKRLYNPDLVVEVEVIAIIPEKK